MLFRSRGCVQLLSWNLRPVFDVFVHVEQFVYRMSIYHIVAVRVFEQCASTLFCSTRLFIARVLRLRLMASIIIVSFLSRSQCIRTVLEEVTWEALVYPRHSRARGASHPLPHADFVAPEVAFRRLRIYESVGEVLDDATLLGWEQGSGL